MMPQMNIQQILAQRFGQQPSPIAQHRGPSLAAQNATRELQMQPDPQQQGQGAGGAGGMDMGNLLKGIQGAGLFGSGTPSVAKPDFMTTAAQALPGVAIPGGVSQGSTMLPGAMLDMSLPQIPQQNLLQRMFGRA